MIYDLQLIPTPTVSEEIKLCKQRRSAYFPGVFASFEFVQSAGNARVERAFALCSHLVLRCSEESSKHDLRKYHNNTLESGNDFTQPKYTLSITYSVEPWPP